MMPIPLSSFLLIAFSFLFMPLIPSQAKEDHPNTTFLFDGFNATQLILEAEASVIGPHSVLALTNHSFFMLGRALYSIPVQMKSNGTVSSFSTTFVFSMVHPSSSSAAAGHGIAFIMMPHTSPIGALPSQYLGLLNRTSNGKAYNHLFAVEFDTLKSVEFLDPDDNHVGVDINSLISVQAESAGYWSGRENSFHGLNLKSGRNIQAWIDYNHPQRQLDVSITLAGLPRPQRPLISLKIDLSNVLQNKMFVGFSATTGNFIEDHYILAWSFTTQGTAPPLNVSRLPSFATMYSKRPGRGFIVGITVATLVFSLAVAALFLIRAKYEETIEEWELEYWPHRITYNELRIATNKFLDENILGQGGFGKVYKGVLPISGQEVAVKCITKELTEGMKGFVSEISSMGRLQHRNLVQLRGWCRRHTKLFIVYDYMPNGSLDKLIFGNPTTVLSWHRRYAILKGVAAGLLYLHHEWEKRVIHRDIKSSNVLLDSEFNGRLGDFGLARLYDHSENPQTTHVVGTLGYIAPELIQTGKATPSSDVFSFGVLLLEVACGRRSVDPLKDTEDMILVEWAWQLYTEGRLLEASDPKLENGGYDECEMERVLRLGLLCSHPEPESRLGMRQVCQILEGEAPLPDIRRASIIVSRYPRELAEDKSGIKGILSSTSDSAPSFEQGQISREASIIVSRYPRELAEDKSGIKGILSSTSDSAPSFEQGQMPGQISREALAEMIGSTGNTENSSAARADLVIEVMEI